ncbi:uncharacterized protein LOC119691450 [Plutella xylostella]|uniref:uncharacterized protein LOC119691450 n=1 Tax=Plutella xylostella TaxID=51655 RepID=UPI00203265C3|nr:uncharacterized protein LOC119691450 [Plutella xylostella]
MHFEVCAAECVGLDLIVVCIYRQPKGDLSLFYSKLNELFSLNTIQNYKVIIMGDININLLVKSTHSKCLIDIVKSSGFISVINFPTRITETSKTCIDHAYTNVLKSDILLNESINLNISDHLGVILILNLYNNCKKNNPTSQTRLFSECKINAFTNALCMYDWDSLMKKYLCPGEQLNSVINITKHMYDVHFPIRIYPSKSSSSAWVSDRARSLRKQISSKKHELLKPNCNIQTNVQLLDLEIKYNSELYNSRKQFLNNSITKYDGSNMCKKVWQVISSETCRTGNNNALNVLVSKTSVDTVDSEGARDAAAATAAALNRFYIEANNNSAKPEINKAITFLNTYLPDQIPTISFKCFTLLDILKVVKNIKRKKSKDIYDMSTLVLDYLPPVLISLLCHLFNECVQCGIYPEALKIIKVQPVYKGKGDMHILKNFRPISQIPIISKIFENLISQQLMLFFNTNNLLNKQQYAYQAGRSTVHAARDVLTKLMSHLDAGRQVAAIFCDLSRAFELVDHSLILNKLKLYGVNGYFLETIASFLHERKQSTRVNNAQSNLETIGPCAVPQGSVMGNNLFLILINDLTTASENVDYVLFADDGCVIVNAESYEQLKSKLNKTISDLSNWFAANGMALNVEKTNIIHFQMRKTRGHELNIVCNNLLVPQVDTVKYLGFTFDSGLTWIPQIDNICSKLSSASYALSRLKPTLSEDNMKKAYFGYFHSILSYGVDIWANSTDAGRAFRSQKRALRIMAGVPWDTPAKQLFIKLKILTLPCLYILEIAKYVRRNLSLFPTNKDVRPNTCPRREDKLYCPGCRLTKSNKLIHIIGPKIYNVIPDVIKNETNEATFTKKLKNMLLNSACYTINEFFDLTSPTHALLVPTTNSNSHNDEKQCV